MRREGLAAADDVAGAWRAGAEGLAARLELRAAKLDDVANREADRRRDGSRASPRQASVARDCDAVERDLAERSPEAARGDEAPREVDRRAVLLEERSALEAALEAGSAARRRVPRERRATRRSPTPRTASGSPQLNAATVQINKLEREKKFLRASRDSPGGPGDRSNKTLEAAFEKLRKEYEGLSRTLNGKLAEEAAAAGLADHDQLRLYASKVQSLEARLQEKTMAAAVSERDAHDAKCAVDKLKVELTDAKFDITRLEASVARAELGRTPYVASARKPRSPAPPPSTPVSEHGFALHDDEAADLTVTLDTYVPPPKMGPTVQEQLAALRAERDANNAALAAPSPEPAKRPLTRAQRAAAAARKSPAVARKVSFAGVAAKENQAA